MRKLIVPFLITTLLAALGAYLNNAYQKYKRDEIKLERVETEHQQQQQFGKTHIGDERKPLSRDSRDRPER